MITDYSVKGVLFLEVSGGENEQAALDYLKHYRSPHLLGIDADYGMMGAYRSTGWPRYVIIDRQGVIRFHGFANDDNLGNARQCIDGLLTGGAGAAKDELVIKDGVALPKFAVEARAARRDTAPRLALGPRGEPWVVFTSHRDGDNNIYLQGPAAAGAPNAQALTTAKSDDYAADCVFDSSGTLWVAWCSNQNGRYDIYVKPCGPGAKGEPMRLTESEDDAMRPRLAAGPDGRLIAVYYKWQKMHGVSRDRDIYARRYEPARGWGEEIAVCPNVPPVEDHTDPDAAIDGQGNAWVVWSYDYHPQLFKPPLDASEPTIFCVRLGADGARSEPMLVGTVGHRRGAIDLFPSVALGGDGRPWCLWDAYDFNGGGRKIRLASLDGEKFSEAAEVSTPKTVSSTPELAPGKDGALIAAWSERTGEGRWVGRVTVLRGGKSAETETIDAKPADVHFIQAAQGRDGKIWACWEQGDEYGARVVVKELSGKLARPESEGKREKKALREKAPRED